MSRILYHEMHWIAQTISLLSYTGHDGTALSFTMRSRYIKLILILLLTKDTPYLTRKSDVLGVVRECKPDRSFIKLLCRLHCRIIYNRDISRVYSIEVLAAYPKIDL